MDNFVQIQRSYQSRSRWEDIAKQIAAGNDGYLNVGDSISCKLKDGTDIVIDVLALNPYEPDSVIFGFRDLHWRKPWNERNTNAGGWRDCQLRKDCNGELLSLLPDDLAAMITPRRIVQKIRGREYESVDKLWIPSYTEVFGTDRGVDQTGDVGDVQFDFFKIKRNRVKFFRDEPYYYALRSPYVANSTNFWYVYSFGYMASTNVASNSFGVCPCFSISKTKVS